MPRPKRSKVAPSGPAPRVRKVLEDSIATNIESRDLKSASSDIYDVSDPEEGIVKSARRIKPGHGRGMTDATPARVTSNHGQISGKTDKRKERPERLPESRSQARHDNKGAIEEDISSDEANLEVEVGRRERNTPGVRNSAIKLGSFKRRSREPSLLARGLVPNRSSSVESDLAEDSGLTNVGKNNTNAIPFEGAQERPRRPSMAGNRGTGVMRSSISLNIERSTPAYARSALKLGNFKRRAREPSLLGTARKPMVPQPEYLDDDEDEEDFNPDDESTPLNLSKTKAMTSSSGASSLNPRKRKLFPIGIPAVSAQPPPLSYSDPVGEDSTPPSVDGELEQDVESPSICETEAAPLINDESDDGPRALLHGRPAALVYGEEESDPESLPSRHDTPVASIEARSSPQLMSETMLPPRSSSASGSEPDLPPPRHVSRGRRPQRTRTPAPLTQDSPISSPPSLTHSPNRPYMTGKTRAKKVIPPPSTFSTAQLQALLPRRRRRTARDPYDVPSSEEEVDTSGLAPDDDELAHMDVRTRQRQRAASRTPAPARRGPKPKAKMPLNTKSAAKRTYGTRPNPVSDKENEETEFNDSLGPSPNADEESPEDSQELEARIGKELKKVTRKFQEVDKWELDFEEATASSSSPKDAR